MPLSFAESEDAAKLWGWMESCTPVVNRRRPCAFSSASGRVANPPQVDNLPYKAEWPQPKVP
jgi:hypothetical protein